jgi:glutathionyl-hydroquinone reductase
VDQAVLDEALKELSAKLDVYEVILGKQKFLAGDVSNACRTNF